MAKLLVKITLCNRGLGLVCGYIGRIVINHFIHKRLNKYWWVLFSEYWLDGVFFKMGGLLTGLEAGIQFKQSPAQPVIPAGFRLKLSLIRVPYSSSFRRALGRNPV
ncbi:MAG: hypothetical protein COB71_08200 [Thiotrichales bacterium]|nr:MAG: hypothetical protein COB71_08200 [Thiotrichales bacterium]